MTTPRDQRFPPFLDPDVPAADMGTAKVVIIPCPFEATTSYRRGCSDGPSAILRASAQLETFDEELKTEPCRVGIHTVTPPAFERMAYEEMAQRLGDLVSRSAREGRLPIILGGEHAITPPAVEAAARAHPGLRAIFLDAHADLRDRYEGSPHSHACALRRTSEMVEAASLGVRILSREEHDHAAEAGIPLIGPREIIASRGRIDQDIVGPLIAGDNRPIYLSIDLDVFDPSTAPAVGTPVPGGLDWYLTLEIVQSVLRTGTVAAVDVVELCPDRRSPVTDFLAARLIYKIIAYWVQSSSLRDS